MAKNACPYFAARQRAVQLAGRKESVKPVALYVRNDDVRSRCVKLVAVYGPLDIADPQPTITVMMPDED